MGSAVWKVFDQTGILISPILIGEAEFDNLEKASNPAFLREIKKDGVKIA